MTEQGRSGRSWVEARRQYPALEARFSLAITGKANIPRECLTDYLRYEACAKRAPEDHKEACATPHRRWILCAAASLLPDEMAHHRDCLRPTPRHLQQCRDLAAELDPKIQEHLGEGEDEEPTPLTEEELGIISSCDADGECVTSKACPSQYGRFFSCLDSRRNDYEQCASEGDELASCAGKFWRRWMHHPGDHQDEEPEEVADEGADEGAEEGAEEEGERPDDRED